MFREVIMQDYWHTQNSLQYDVEEKISIYPKNKIRDRNSNYMQILLKCILCFALLAVVLVFRFPRNHQNLHKNVEEHLKDKYQFFSHQY